MRQSSLQNQRTTRALNSVNSFTFRSHKFQLWILPFQFCFIINWLRICRSQFLQNILNLRNNIASLKNHHSVASPNIQTLNFIGVMQTGVLHRSSSHHHWIKHSHRSCRASPPNRNHYIPNNRRSFFSRILISHRPTRIFTHHPEIVIYLSIVNLNNQPVRIKRQIMTLIAPFINKFHHVGQIIKNTSLLIARNPQRRQSFIGKAIRRNFRTIITNHIISAKMQRARRHQRRI